MEINFNEQLNEYNEFDEKRFKNSFVSIQDLEKIYPNGVKAVYDFNLDIKHNEFIVIVGPSGCGKTTTLRMIAGLEDISSGGVFVDEELINYKPSKDRKMAMVFQNGGLLNSLSVEENVGLYLKEHRLKTPAQIKSIVEKELTKLNLTEEDARKYPYELSGGMKKRVAIARAIVMEPKVVLYDEPTSELDPVVAKTVVDEIRRIHQEEGQTTVIVTHDRELAFEIADHIAILIDGTLLKMGTAMEIKEILSQSIPKENKNLTKVKNFLTINYKSIYKGE